MSIDDDMVDDSTEMTLEDLLIPDATDEELEAAMKGKPIPKGRQRLVLGTITLQFTRDDSDQTRPDDKRGVSRPYLLVPLTLEDDQEGYDSILISAFWQDNTHPEWMSAPWLYKPGNGLCLALGSKYHGRPGEWKDEVQGFVVEGTIKHRKNKLTGDMEAYVDKFC